MVGIGVGLVIVALVGYVIATYNGLVRLRQQVEEAWSGIDVQLKRRYDLIPNLVESVRGYATHERGLFEEVARARSAAAAVPKGDVEGRAGAESMLGAVMGRFMAVAEAYPELQANENFQTLMASLDDIEREVQHSRRYYNGAGRQLNVKVETFPSNLIAGQFGFEKVAYFTVDDESERVAPKVSF